MEGSLVWTRDRFEVTKTRSGFYGGKLAIDFSMKPLGDPARPGIARLETAYEDVDVAGLMEARAFAGLRLDGRATGRNLLTWPLGRFREHTGDGEIRVAAATALQDRTLPAACPPERRGRAAAGVHVAAARASTPRASRSRRAAGRRASRSCSRTPIGGAIRYTYGPEWVTFAPGWIATPSTYVELQGRTAYGRSVGARPST